MNRSKFLKRIGLGIVAIPLAPKIAAELAENLPVEETVETEGYYPPMREMSIHKELYKRYGDRPIQEVIEIYHETGNLIYRK